MAAGMRSGRCGNTVGHRNVGPPTLLELLDFVLGNKAPSKWAIFWSNIAWYYPRL